MLLKHVNSKMELKIKEEKVNPLFSRKEINAEVQADSVPSRADVEKLVSEKLKAPIENIKIENIKGKFGINVFTVNALIYDSKEAKDNIEPKPKVKGTAGQ